MKTILKRIWDDGLISFISKAQWDFIRFTNAVAAIAITAILVISMPSPDSETTFWLLAVAAQLSIALTIHARASEIEKKMVEIDAANDERDNHMRNHVELVYQDVRWLVGRELSRKDRSRLLVGHPGYGLGGGPQITDEEFAWATSIGNPDHPDFVGPHPEFDNRDIPS